MPSNGSPDASARPGDAPPDPRALPRILLVTGMSGAGMSTTLRALQDLGWETVDNLPISLLDPLVNVPRMAEEGLDRPLAIGIDARTRGFSSEAILTTLLDLRERGDMRLDTLFLDCAGAELERRFSETRRRHPLAADRPAADGIAQERELLEPLRRWADAIIDTTSYSAPELTQDVRRRYAPGDRPSLTVTVMSFGFARGLPRNADLVFDMRFLRNPHWDPVLRPQTGLDAAVADYVRADPGYDEVVDRMEALLLTILPRYAEEGRSYLTIAIGCTGGRHRSVHVAERIALTLARAGFAPALLHRDLDRAPPSPSLEARVISA